MNEDVFADRQDRDGKLILGLSLMALLLIGAGIGVGFVF